MPEDPPISIRLICVMFVVSVALVIIGIDVGAYLMGAAK